MQTSTVGIYLLYRGDLFKFWELLKEMKKDAEDNKIIFECGEITTLTEE